MTKIHTIIINNSNILKLIILRTIDNKMQTIMGAIIKEIAIVARNQIIRTTITTHLVEIVTIKTEMMSCLLLITIQID